MPEKVERKIRYLIRKFPSTEWSGVLFVSHTGTFEGDDLVITCEDIYPMDLGTSGWTEFKMSEEVAAYMAENIELFDYDTALVHSHHSLGAFLSSQDIKMVQQEGNDTNCFVSLVVDTRGKYVAIVTRKVQTKSEVTVKNLGTSYEFFGEGTKEITHDGTETTKVIDKEVIEYYDLEVERHEVSNDLEYLDARFDEIQRRKSHVRRESPEVNKGFLDWLHEKQPKEQSLFGNDITLSSEEEEKINDVALSWQPDAKKVHKAVTAMVTCDLIINPDKIDLGQWIVKYMTNVYGKIFKESADGNSYSTAFEEWKDFIVNFLLYNFDTAGVPDELLCDMELFLSRVAMAMYQELEEYKEVNNYIVSYQDALASYIVE